MVGGLTFLAFAAWTLRERSFPDDDPSPSNHAGGSAVAAVALAFLLAELGDKTMLVIITLAAQSSPLATWAGATAGLMAADALAIAFAAFGILLLVSALPL